MFVQGVTILLEEAFSLIYLTNPLRSSRLLQNSIMTYTPTKAALFSCYSTKITAVDYVDERASPVAVRQLGLSWLIH